MPTWFDTHAHLDDFAAAGTLDAVLARAAAAGVTRICAMGGSPAANALAARLASKHPGFSETCNPAWWGEHSVRAAWKAETARSESSPHHIFPETALIAAVGYDRDLASSSPDLDALRDLAQSTPAVRAIGEIGLDYYYDPDGAPAQRALFSKMLALALDLRLPVCVHSRDADSDTLAALREFSNDWKKSFQSLEKNPEVFQPLEKTFPIVGKNDGNFPTIGKNVSNHWKTLEPPDCPPPGILHCYTRGPAMAEELVDMGFYISFSGILSFNNAGPLREVASRLPLDRLLVETDSPYLAPKPFRGKTCEPMYTARTGEVLAEARSAAPADIAAATTNNAFRVFRIQPTSSQDCEREGERNGERTAHV